MEITDPKIFDATQRLYTIENIIADLSFANQIAFNASGLVLLFHYK
ncbi:hypothetical protein PORCAN_708 [Porphyromonas crevioricanis JCM 13913]|nr:hypothetical protein PORCAN_708 [Porphyromonas crevioricanis JCM 13913]